MISDLASKKRSNQKNEGTSIFQNINSFFRFELFLEAKQESLKNSLLFGPNDDTKNSFWNELTFSRF